MDFLFEIGLEEIPARMIAGAEAELRKRLVSLLERERLITGEDFGAVSHSTPRRLAVHVRGVDARQQDLLEEVLGPAAKIAFKDGAPAAAAIAFARKTGVDIADLKTVSTPRGDYIAATSVKPGKAAIEVIAAELPKEIAAIYWAKNMYWRAGKPERFVRPVRWLLALLGEQVVPVEFGGYSAGRVTFGHRVLHGAAVVSIDSPADYVQALTKASVMADVELRRHTIRKALDHVCRRIPDARWREDHALVDKMTHLTEWPSVIAGSFDPSYLELPEEVLVTVMRDHQNYFAVEDKDGKLAPHFLAVLNTVADAAGDAVIRHGNERVLRARFNDARFFWEFDQRTPLAERVKMLENVTFQKDLGSYAAKSVRVRLLCQQIVTNIDTSLFDPEALSAAATYAKTDLTCELVKEFTELQGIIGGLYARAQGFADKMALAIYDQYLPESMDDRIPHTVEGQLLAIADKADTIAGMFSLSLEPTGSKDPFALRRAANGIVKILAEGDVSLPLSEIAHLATNGYRGVDPVHEKIVRKLELFFAERLDFYLREVKAQAYDVVKAVLAVDANDVRDAVARAEAVSAARDSEDFRAVSAAFKRMQNILTQAREKGLFAAKSVNEALLTEATEQALWSSAQMLEVQVAAHRNAGDYTRALALTATLRPQVDAFFDAVMVMAQDPEVRANRLAVLTRILTGFGAIVDFSEIVVSGIPAASA